jgi:DNA gyrase subunit A
MSITTVSIVDEIKHDFLSYSTAIFNRSLPDVVDGLKVSQRRVLLALKDLDLKPSSSYCKVTRVEGHTLGTYHPQGNCSGTIINLGQQSSQRYTLTDLHGNAGGSIQTGEYAGQMVSDDSPAAARYLEVRSASISQKLYIEQVIKGVGEWRDNYDGSKQEPVRIVPLLPTLLLTGTQGIASGYACSHISWPLSDVANATVSWIKSPKIRDSTLAGRFTRPPEPPQGGRIVKDEGVVQALLTGKGAITAYGQWVKDDNIAWGKRSKRPGLVITRLAQGSSERFLERVRELAEAEKLPGLVDASDHSSRDGIRIVLVFKTAEDRDLSIPSLVKNTGLKHVHNVSCVAVGIDGKPVTVGVRQAIACWYKARVDYLCELHGKEMQEWKAKESRLNAVITVLNDLDVFINTVKKSSTKEQAVDKVMKKWKLSRDLATYVIGIPISSLIGTEIGSVREDLEMAKSKASDLERLSHPGGDLDAYICGQIASVRCLESPARSVWMTESIPETPPAPQGRKDVMKAEAEKAGISPRKFNKWLKENLGKGDIDSRWGEFIKSSKSSKANVKNRAGTETKARCSARSSKAPKRERVQGAGGKKRGPGSRSKVAKNARAGGDGGNGRSGVSRT